MDLVPATTQTLHDAAGCGVRFQRGPCRLCVLMANIFYTRGWLASHSARPANGVSNHQSGPACLVSLRAAACSVPDSGPNGDAWQMRRGDDLLLLFCFSKPKCKPKPLTA